MTSVLAVGLGVTGLAVARHCAGRGWTCVIVEDDPDRAGHAERTDEASAAGASVLESPSVDELTKQAGAADLIVASPGVPVGHAIYDAAEQTGTPLVSEIELAASATDIPIVAVTGTNGKSTVTTLVAEMLRASGLRAQPAGNIGRPLVEAIGDDLDVVVAEVSSFQLQYTDRFHPVVAVILNIADDHLDWHPSFEHYREAKARIFANQSGADVVVLNADDPVVAALAAAAPAGVVWFTTAQEMAGAFHVSAGEAGGQLVAPSGDSFFDIVDLPRALPHDLANALAASAAALAVGATVDGVAAALRAHRSLPHTLALVDEAGGVRWYDDSKATNPHATLAALSGFDSVVLLAGGRNKGLSLDALTEAAPCLRAVVAFGEAGPEIEAVFGGVRPVERVSTIRGAVHAAAQLAEPGDAVILSPACASFDAYPNYRVRGDDFATEVRAFLDGEGAR